MMQPFLAFPRRRSGLGGRFATPPLAFNGDSGAGARTYAIVVSAGVFAAGNGSHVRLTFRAGSVAGFTIAKCSIGPAVGSGDTYDRSALTPITFNNGNAGTGAISAGATVTSDVVPYIMDNTKAQVIKWYCSGAGDRFRLAQSASPAPSTWHGWYKGGSDTADTLDDTGFSNDGDIYHSLGLDTIEW